MLMDIAFFIMSAVFIDFVGYWLHRWAHKKHSPLFRPHMTHHLKNYPPKAVISEEYRSSKSDSLAIWFIPFGILYTAFIIGLGIPHQIAIFSGGAIVASISSWLHDETHLANSIVWRKKIFRDAAVRHHAHHFKMRRNYGVITDVWDRIFRTRKRE